MNYLKSLIGNPTPMLITKLKKDRLSLEKHVPISSKTKLMSKLDSLKNKIRQRLGLNFVAYMGNNDFNDDWMAGYDQARKDVMEAFQQYEIYMPYLDEE